MQSLNERSEFKNWKVNLDHYSLINKQGDEIFVEPRLLKVLSFLTKHANKVATRNELTDYVWEDVVVTDESLSKAIFDLRKFLNENFKGAPQIVTIRKVGYKLESNVQVVSQPYRFFRLTAKVLAYMLILMSLFAIVVRAIRYEN